MLKLSTLENTIDMTESNIQQKFNDIGYVVVKKMLDKDIVDLVSQYALFDQIQNFQIETAVTPQIPGTHSKYADPMMESMLLKLLPEIEKKTGLCLHPTYSYYRVYKSRDVLHQHTDRPACEISVTVCFNFDYKESNGTFDWPIWMKDSPCSMEPGDAVIYRGCELTHWRDTLEVPNDAWHIQAFFHYVDANGPLASEQFDKRPCIGYKHQHGKSISGPSSKKYITFTE